MSSHSLYRDELLKEAFHPRVSAYYFKQWVGYQMPFHAHHSVEIMYVMEGSCTIALEEEEVSMKKGEFIFIDADLMHRLLVDTGKSCRMLNVEFGFGEPEGASPTLREMVLENQPLAFLLSEARPFFVLKDTAEVFHTLKSLVLELDERGNQGEMMVLLLLSQLLIQIGRLAETAWRSGLVQPDTYIKKTLQYLQHHYDCDVQVKDVAAAVQLHPGYLHRVFKSHTGQSIMEYLTSLRVDKAKMLLAQTEIPVAEIPDYIGVNSRPYFNVMFKKNTGTTPVQYRKSFEKQRRELSESTEQILAKK
jgi:AraC-like DNA-binding protein